MAALGEMGISKPQAAAAAQALLAPAPPPSTAATIAGVDLSSSISSHKPSCALPLLPSASQAHEEAISLHLVANLSWKPRLPRTPVDLGPSSPTPAHLGVVGVGLLDNQRRKTLRTPHTRIGDGDEPRTRHRSGSTCRAAKPRHRHQGAWVAGMRRRAPCDAPSVAGYGQMHRPVSMLLSVLDVRCCRG